MTTPFEAKAKIKSGEYDTPDVLEKTAELVADELAKTDAVTEAWEAELPNIRQRFLRLNRETETLMQMGFVAGYVAGYKAGGDYAVKCM